MEPLTKEQVAILRVRHEQADYHRISDLCDSHERLRERVAELEKWYTAWGTEHSHHDCAACAAVDALRETETRSTTAREGKE